MRREGEIGTYVVSIKRLLREHVGQDRPTHEEPPECVCVVHTRKSPIYKSLLVRNYMYITKRLETEGLRKVGKSQGEFTAWYLLFVKGPDKLVVSRCE